MYSDHWKYSLSNFFIAAYFYIHAWPIAICGAVFICLSVTKFTILHNVLCAEASLKFTGRFFTSSLT